jgi:tetratricopeptide (TPR) repeat protein
VDLDRPVVVIAAKDENTMRALAPEYWERRGGTRPGSVFVSAPEAHYISLRADIEVEDQGMNPWNQAFAAYSMLVLGQTFGDSMPLWLANGLSALLSNTVIREKEIAFGKPLPWHVETFQTAPRLPLSDLFAVTRETPYYRQAISRERFDAQSWAVVQYMIFGLKGDLGGRFNQLSRMLLAGAPVDQAVVELYGNLEALENAYLLYARQGVFTYGRLQVESDTSAARPPSRTMAPAEHAAARGAWHVAMGRPVEARALIDEGRKADATLAAVDDAEALLLDRERQNEPARAAFAKAAAAGSSSFWTHYRLASLQWQPGLSDEVLAGIRKSLEQSTSLNPNFAEGYAYLANVQMQGRDSTAAVDAARRAAELAPRVVRHRLSLARALASASRVPEAQAVAADALRLARSDQERAALDSLLASLAARPVQRP